MNQGQHAVLRSLLVLSGLAIAIGSFVAAGGLPKAAWGFPGSSAAWALGFVGAGFLADRARPDIPVGLLMMLGGVVAAVQEVIVQVSLRAGDDLGTGLAIVNQTVNWLWMVALSFVINAVLRFPDGTRLGPGWKKVEVVLWTVTGINSVASIFGPGETFPNPLEIDAWSGALGFVVGLGNGLWNVLVIGALASIVVRLRRARGIERQQIKWLVFAVGIVGVLALIGEVLQLNLSADVYLTVSALLAASILLIPIAMAIAMLRYRLYDIDRVVSRSVAYSLLATFLGLTYAGGVVGLQAISPASGNLAVAASTLVVAVLFNPVRLRVQRWVDRRFNRASYDAAQEVDAFTTRLRSAVDPAAITLDLGAVLASTIQPSSALVWIRGETRA
jgi:hypothetical protein